MLFAKTKPAGALSKKSKIHPFQNRSAEEFCYRGDTSDSSEYKTYNNKNHQRQKNVAFKSEEKSQLIRGFKNDSKSIKYNTFEPTAAVVKYVDSGIVCS